MAGNAAMALLSAVTLVEMVEISDSMEATSRLAGVASPTVASESKRVKEEAIRTISVRWIVVN